MRAVVFRRGALHRAAQVVELVEVANDVERVGDHPRDLPLEHRLQLLLPVELVGLGGGEHDPPGFNQHRQDVALVGVGVGDRGRDLRDVDLERVDTQVLQIVAPGEPLGQVVERQRLVRLALGPVVLVADQHQRVDARPTAMLVGDAHLARLLGVEQAVRDQILQHHLECQGLTLAQLQVVGGSRCGLVHRCLIPS
jgi:hypothetical protein